LAYESAEWQGGCMRKSRWLAAWKDSATKPAIYPRKPA